MKTNRRAFLGGSLFTLASAGLGSKIQAGVPANTHVPQGEGLPVLVLEVGIGLIPFVSPGGDVLVRISSLRKQIKETKGFLMPQVRIRDNTTLQPSHYQIKLHDTVIARGEVWPERYAALDPGDVVIPVEGIKAQEPAYGLDCLWIEATVRDRATSSGYTVVNPETIIATHLGKLVTERADEILSWQDVQRILDEVRGDHPRAVAEVEKIIPFSEVVEVFRQLLREGVSIRQHALVVETMAQHCRTFQSASYLSRPVRRALSRVIVEELVNSERKLIGLSMERSTEDHITRSLTIFDDGSAALTLDVTFAKDLIERITDKLKAFERTGTVPVLMCGGRVRFELSKLLRRFVPGLVVIAFDEIPVDVATETVATIG